MHKICGRPPKRSLKRGTLVLKSLGTGIALFSAPMVNRVRHYMYVEIACKGLHPIMILDPRGSKAQVRST